MGAKTSLDFLASMSAAKFCNAIDLFESAFEAINPSKVNVGKFRRELSSYYIAHLDDFSDSDLSEIENSFFEQTLTE